MNGIRIKAVLGVGSEEGLLELFHKDLASGAFQPSFRVPPPLVEGLKHLQWSRCARDSDDDYVIDEAHSNYELNALGCALCFGYTLDLLAALMIAGADENSRGCVLNGRRCTPRQLAQQNQCESDLACAWEIVRDCPPSCLAEERLPPVCLDFPSMPVSMSFKVMTWNIKTLGHNIPGRDYDQIAKLLAARVIICVQETKSHGFQGNAGPLFRAMSDRGFAWTVGEKTCDDDLPNAYEHPLIFYRALRFDLKAGSVSV